MDNAQLYLSLVRPSMIPVVGESADDLFKGQIEVTAWKWAFHNEDEKVAAERKKKRVGTLAKRRQTTFKSEKLTKEIEDLQSEFDDKVGKAKGKDAETAIKYLGDIDKSLERLKANSEEAYWEVRKRQEQEEDQRTRDEERHEDEKRQREGTLHDETGDENFKFSFMKRIDIATTQMLNSLKQGDKFPVAIFTMHQYSSNNPMSLVIKVQGLRLLEYGLKVDGSDTMTDLKEEWKCDFEAISYVYQNRRSVAKPSLGSVSDAKQIAAKAATQGTVRAFAMKNTKLF